MAQTIYCDAECELPADQIISDTATGEQLAFCVEHFLSFCSALAEAATAQVVEAATGPAPDPEAAAALAEAQEGPATPAPKSANGAATATTPKGKQAQATTATAAAD